MKRFALANGPAVEHPRHVYFVSELPLGGTNKIDRRELAARAVRLVAESRATAARATARTSSPVPPLTPPPFLARSKNDRILTVADVQAMLDASPFIRGCGMKVVRLDAEALEIAVELPMRPEFERRAGTGQWHGGPIAALIDTAGDYALALHAGGPVPTINFRTDYLRPAVNTTLAATARVRRRGARSGSSTSK